MGDPRKQRKKYTKPSHPWQEERLGEERGLLEEYGLKNKQEIWKMKSLLKKFAQQAKKLITSTETQAEIEKNQLMAKLKLLGLIEENAQLEDVLAIEPKNILERRLQTLVFRKKFSKSIRQARQFITHRHILVNGKLVTFPSYLVTKAEEDKIEFISSSPLFSQDHPERIIKKTKEKSAKKEKKEEKKEQKSKKPKKKSKKEETKQEKKSE